MSKENILQADKDTPVHGCLIQHSSTGASIAEPEDIIESDPEVDTKNSRTMHKSNAAATAEVVHVPTKVDNRRKHNSSCASQTANCLKRFAVFLLSYVGLTCAVVAYSIMGGFVFVALEAKNEELVKDKALDLQRTVMNRIEYHINMTLHYHIHYKNETYNWTLGMLETIQAFQYNTCLLVTDEGWNGHTDNDAENAKWTYAGALLYSVTVITTIGFGNITPKTTWGRVVTMLYAILGIPLTILCLTTIGRGMASLFRALYGRTLCVECRQYLMDSVRVRRVASTVSLDKIELDALPNNLKDRNYTTNATTTTGSQGDGNHRKSGEAVPHHHETEVPIFICLFLVIWWLVFGAILFSIWEEWDLFTGTYFCFITLTTIGFGDIVPGISHAAWDDQVKQVACSFYLLIGLSMIAMCFDLMQIRGRTLARNVATVLGLVKENRIRSH